MNVLMLSPGFPVEQPHFTRGLAEVGATVYGMGDQPQSALPEIAKKALARTAKARSSIQTVALTMASGRTASFRARARPSIPMAWSMRVISRKPRITARA